MGPLKAVEFFRQILWCEANRTGIGKDLIHAPTCINQGDGGLDVFIKDVNPNCCELIPSGTSGFQVKSSDLKPDKCIKELYQKNKPRKKTFLKPGVNEILKISGTYVLVIFANLSHPNKYKRENSIKKELQKYNPSVKVRLYTSSEIVGFSQNFPAAIYQIKPVLMEAEHYDSWAGKLEVCFPRKYIPDPEREKLITEIQEKLRDINKKNRIIRIIGKSGIGKTRLVFQALNPVDLRSCVIYAKANKFITSSLYDYLRNVENSTVIIVLDDCPLDIHKLVTNDIAIRGQHIFLMTIGMLEENENAENYLLYHLKETSQETINQIINSEMPEIPNSIVLSIVSFSAGFPRIAVLLINEYKSNPINWNDRSININDETLVNRLIGGTLDPISEYFRDLKRICLFLSLFPFLGYSGDSSDQDFELSVKMEFPVGSMLNPPPIPNSLQSKWLASQIGIDWNRFQEYLDKLKQREVVQGDNLIYLSPYPLVKYCVNAWWQIYGDNVLDFVKNFPQNTAFDLKSIFLSNLMLVSFSLHEQSTYLKVLRLVNYVIGERISAAHILYFINAKLRPEDKEILLNRYFEDPNLISSFLNFLINPLGNVPPEQKMLWYEKVISDNNGRIMLAEILNVHFRLFNADMRNSLILRLSEHINDTQLAKKIIILILNHYDDLKWPVKRKLRDLFDNMELFNGTLPFIYFYFRNLPFWLKKFIVINSLDHNQNFFLQLLVTYASDSTFSDTQTTNLLKIMSNTEGFLPFITEFLIKNIKSLDNTLISELTHRVAQFNTPMGKANRKILSSSPYLPTSLRMLLEVPANEITDEINNYIKNQMDIYSKFIINKLLFEEQKSCGLFTTLKVNFKPQTISMLIISDELNPKPESNNCFYNCFTKNPNLLFNAIISVVFPSQSPQDFIKTRYGLLCSFIRKGYYVEEAFPLSNIITGEDSLFLMWINNVYHERLGRLISIDTPIIIINDYLYTNLVPRLKEWGYNVINTSAIPKPTNENLVAFKVSFKETIARLCCGSLRAMEGKTMLVPGRGDFKS